MISSKLTKNCCYHYVLSGLDLRVSEGKGAMISVDELRELMTSVRKEYMTGMETKNYTGTLEQTIDVDGSTETQQATLRNVKTGNVAICDCFASHTSGLMFAWKFFDT